MITCIKSTSSFTRTSWLPLQNTFPLIWRLIHHIVLGNGSQKNAIFMTCGYRNALQFQQCFFAYNPFACYTYTSQSGGEESGPEEEKQSEQIIAFLPLCLFPGADECEEKRHRSVGLGSVVLVRPEETSPVERTLSDSTFLCHFSLFCSLSSIVVPAERRLKRKKKLLW